MKLEDLEKCSNQNNFLVGNFFCGVQVVKASRKLHLLCIKNRTPLIFNDFQNVHLL